MKRQLHTHRILFLFALAILNLVWTTDAQTVSLPSAPSSLSAVAVSSNRINLTWRDNSSNESGFRIYRAPTSSGPWTQITATYVGVVSYANTPLTPATTYYYRVCAYNWHGNSSYTTVSSATTQPMIVVCSYSISPASATIVAGGGNGSVSVTAGAGCAWAASSSTSWIALNNSGSGNGTATYTVAANASTSSRTGTLTIAGKTFTVTQSGASAPLPPPPCSYSISPTSTSSPSTGGSGYVTVTAGAGCGWTASSSASWAILSTGSGSGNANVGYTVSPNGTTNARSATLTIAGRSFSISQAGAVLYTPPPLPPPPTGGSTWIRPIGGTGSDSGRATVVDGSGNIFVAGTFQSSLNCGGSSLTCAGGVDIFLAKYTAAGAHVWSKQIGSSGGEAVRGIALDASGNIYMTGHFTGTGDLGAGSVTSAGMNDIFVAKYSATGSCLWVRAVGGTDDDIACGLAVDGAGNVVVTGYFRRWVDFGGGIIYATFNGQDAFLAKYSASGAHVWSKTIWGDSTEEGTGVALDSVGNILMTGKFLWNTDVGKGVMATKGGMDFYIAKFTGTGVALWSRAFGGTGISGIDGTVGVSADRAGDVVLLGYFSQSIDFGGGVLRTPTVNDYDVFLAKFSGVDGGYRWAKSFPGPGNELPYALAVDANNNVAITGYFQQSINLGGNLFTSYVWGAPDCFVAKYSPTGAHVWSERFGGTGGDYGVALAACNSGYFLLTGMFSGAADFGGQSCTSVGASDAFLIRLDP